MLKSLVKNAADPAQVREAEIKEKFGRERDLEDVRFVLSTPEGRRFIWKILANCGVFKISFTGEANSTFFNEGQRNIGIPLLNDAIEADQNLYLRMADEAKGEK